MRISKFLELAPKLYSNGISVHLKSMPGIGKSSVIEHDVPQRIKAALNMSEFSVHMPPPLASIDSVDVRGFTVPVKREDGRMVTKSTISPFIPDSSMGPNGIVFIDEEGQGSQDVRKPTSTLRLDGRIGEDQLGDGWVVWCASNRVQDNSGVSKPMMHLINRELEIHLEFHEDDWIGWAQKQQGIHPLFMAFPKFKPGSIAQEVPREPVPFCTPRSYARFAQLVWDVSNGNVDAELSDTNSLLHKVVLELGMGMIGKAVAGEALAFMKVANDLPSWKLIVSDPDAAAKKIPAGRLDVVYSSTIMAVHNVDHDTVEPVFKFITSLPKEFQTATLTQMLDKLGGSALNHPLFRAWVKENPALISGTFA
jgi:hypothetical protein